jgi:transposase InsO family protein
VRRANLVTPEPAKKPKSSYIRFAAEQPNETWQADFTHHRLADGADTEILTWLDDHSRYAMSVTATDGSPAPPSSPHSEPASTATESRSPP